MRKLMHQRIVLCMYQGLVHEVDLRESRFEGSIGGIALVAVLFSRTLDKILYGS